MTTPIRAALEVAHGALMDLESAKRALLQLESLLFSASTGKEHPFHVANLVEIAWALAGDAANTASCNYEQISHALDKCAPQNADTENVAREVGDQHE